MDNKQANDMNEHEQRLAQKLLFHLKI